MDRLVEFVFTVELDQPAAGIGVTSQGLDQDVVYGGSRLFHGILCEASLDNFAIRGFSVTRCGLIDESDVE